MNSLIRRVHSTRIDVFSTKKVHESAKHLKISTKITFFIFIENNKMEIIRRNSLLLFDFKKFIQFSVIFRTKKSEVI
jgi:hypothetical protein